MEFHNSHGRESAPRRVYYRCNFFLYVIGGTKVDVPRGCFSKGKEIR